jgi:hypothetical protein
MIRTCRVCEKKYSTDNRGWYDRFLLHVCSSACLRDFVLGEPQMKKNSGLIEFKESDRSFRSNYERRFAKYLGKIGIPWLYEPYKVAMTNGDFYVPDFLLNNSVFFEVKGIWDGRGKTKFKSFIDNYPDLPIFVVDLHMLSLMGRTK